MLFSGGALIVGGAARSDLAGPELTDHLTHHEFETLQRAFSELPDDTVLNPTHGGGSFCAAGSGKQHTSTLGEERMTNPLLSMSEQEFLTSWPASFPRTPVYFSRMREINWSGARLRKDIEMPRPLTPEAFAAAASHEGSIVVDVRDPASYAEAHGQGALAIPFRDAFPTWLGWLVPADARLALRTGRHGARGRRRREPPGRARAVRGLPRRAGWTRGARPVCPSAPCPRSVPTTWSRGSRRVPRRSTCGNRMSSSSAASREPCRCRSATCRSMLGTLPAGRPLLVYCASGMRSTTAASLLERAGVGPVVNLKGGYGAWQEAGRD